MIVKAHTSIIGETGYNCHSRNFFKALDELIPVQVRNWTIGHSWNGYNDDEPHNGEYYMDNQLKKMLVEQTLSTPNGHQEFPLYQSYHNDGKPDVHIVLNDNIHKYFWDNYDGIKIGYNVWETTRQPDVFFEQLKKFDQVWVPTEWQRKCTVEQGIPSEKVKVVPEGVDVNMYKPKNRVVSKPIDRPFRFILVGRWEYRKSTREIIQTFTNTFSEDENIELLLLVDNEFASDGLNSTEERLEKFGISHKGIKVLHHLSKDEYVETLKSCDVFLSCARSEGWNLPLIEAMACGIPSFYSNWGGQLEFAKDKGIPIQIKEEISASVVNDESWNSNTPGNFAEPDFEDLSSKMKEVIQNYTFYKRKSLEESDEIREKFTWKNAAKIANDILNDLVNQTQSKYDDSVAIVLAHPNTPKRIKMLEKCLQSIPIQKIISVNYPVTPEIQELSDWVVFSKENPILDRSEFDKYGVDYHHWWIEPNGEKKIEPYKCEHGYAAYSLTREGIRLAKSLGKKKIHVINYDYTFSHAVLSEHENLLESSDLVFYVHNDWEFDQNNSYCSAFTSGKTEKLEDFFFKYNSKDEYYSSMSGFNILEIQLYNHYSNPEYKKTIMDIESLKKKVDVNKECAYQHLNTLVSSELVGKSFKEISDAVNCDKSTYHRYDEIYPTYIDKWKNEPINIFEVGIEDGKSLEIWKNYFRYSKIWGMDISRKHSGDRYEVFIGDQSNIDDLIDVSNKIPKCELIVDDGSHIPEHQLKTFDFLFRNVLKSGGVYIIEDIECSYWDANSSIYGYETGHLNIVDYFTKLNHSVNSHYNTIENDLDIKSITFGPNCIIVTKNENDKHKGQNYRFSGMLKKPPYKKADKMEIKTNQVSNPKNQININFVDEPFVEITGDEEKQYTVNFIDSETDVLVYSTTIKNNQWVKCNRKWFTTWKIEIKSSSGEIYIHEFNPENKRVFIVFESSSLGDTLAWIPYVEEFRKKHKCKVIVSTFQNRLFESVYPEIEFVEPGISVSDLYALYRIGCFYDENGVDLSRHKTDFKKLSLQEYASDILGLDYTEIRPRIKSIKPMSSEKPYICIANHSTAQPKYWNNPTGWQELVDYVKSLGYDVYLLSREEDGYMGNKNPDGVIKVDGKSLEEIGGILLGSKGFVGLGSGLSWYAWSLGIPTTLISGFSEPYQEMKDVYRVINKSVCHGCFARHLFDRGDWNWCPDHKGTDRQFECTKTITFDMVKPKLNQMLGL